MPGGFAPSGETSILISAQYTDHARKIHLVFIALSGRSSCTLVVRLARCIVVVRCNHSRDSFGYP